MACPAPTPRAPTLAQLASFHNLFEAARKARRSKRSLPAAARFEHHLARNLVLLRDQLLSGEYRPGPYRTFDIWEPAHREISAAPYRDRVVHHALCNLIEPLFERSFIHDSYANRKGKGTHAALHRCTQFARRHPFVFQGDIRLFFPSVDHEILAARLARRIRDPQVLALARLILDNSNPQQPADFYFPGDDLFSPFERRRGLPIGNLTSQFWANVYLDPLDHFFRDQLAVPGYIRYVDDFLVFANSKDDLAYYRDVAIGQLDRLRLLLHPRKSRIYPVSEGIPFLGFRVFPTHRRLLPAAVRRARERLQRLSERHNAGLIPWADVQASVQAWIAHASHGDTLGLRQALFEDAVFRAGGYDSGARGRLEQQQEQRPLRRSQQQQPGEP